MKDLHSRIFTLLLACAGISAISCKSNSGQTETITTTVPASQTVQTTPTPNRFDLTREAVLALVRNRMTKRAQAGMPKMSLVTWGTFRTYQAMVEANILSCERGMLGDFLECQPGPNGRVLRRNNIGLALVIGQKVPSVTGISRPEQTSALAQVTLTFQPSGGFKFFEKWREVFTEYDTENEEHTVHLRLYDDGWRIESIE